MNPVNNQNAVQMLQQMQAMADGAAGNRPAEAGNDGPQFMQALQDAVGNVNEAQLTSGELQNAFVSGEDVELTEVVVAMQKAQVAFEATKQVRNQLVEAYQDIYNMPV